MAPEERTRGAAASSSAARCRRTRTSCCACCASCRRRRASRCELLAPVSLPLDARSARALPDDAMLVEYFRVGDAPARLPRHPRHAWRSCRWRSCPRVQHLLRLLQFQLSWARPAHGGAPPARASRSLAADAGAPAGALRRAARAAAAAARRRPPDLRAARPAALRAVPRALRRAAAPDRLLLGLVRSERDDLRAVPRAAAAERGGPSLSSACPTPQTPFIADEVRSVAARAARARSCTWARKRPRHVLREKGRGEPLRPHRRARLLPAATTRCSPASGSAARYLTLYDLYNLKLPAELVTLSACVTGLNVIAAGDELLGLARGLFRAGRGLAAARRCGRCRTRAPRSS